MIDVRFEAYKIITKVLSKNIFSDKLLVRMTNKLKAAGEDAGLLYVLVKGVIKMQRNLDHILSLFVDQDKFVSTNQKIKVVLYIALYQLIYCDHIPDYAAVDEAVKLGKKLFNDKIGNFINAVLRAYLRSGNIEYPKDPIERLATVYSYPVELVRTWSEYWGLENTEILCRYYNKIPSLHIRINNLATDKKRLEEYFKRRDIQYVESPYSKDILITDRVYEVINNIALEEGYFSIQDTSSALVVRLLDPNPEESILDLFAGPGGKATYIAEIMHNTGEIIAVDKFPEKIKKIKKAMEILQIKNIKTVVKDALQYGPIAPAFDKVLLDVPCSGWGVFQKKAELRWQKNQNMNELLKLQENALKYSSSFVKSGGFLIYSTCTLNHRENEEQVMNFLKRNQEFTLVPPDNTQKNFITEDGFLKTVPFKHNMDGAFAAKMQKS